MYFRCFNQHIFQKCLFIRIDTEFLFPSFVKRKLFVTLRNLLNVITVISKLYWQVKIIELLVSLADLAIKGIS